MNNYIAFLLAVNILGIPILLICLALIRLFPKPDDSGANYINALLIMNIVYLVSSTFDCLAIGKTGEFARFIINLDSYLQFALTYLMGGCLLLFILKEISLRRHIIFNTIWVYALCAGAILLLCLNLFNHMYFYVDEQSLYHNGNQYWLSQFVGLVIVVAAFVLIYENHSLLPGWLKYAWYSYTVLPFLVLATNVIMPRLAEVTNTIGLFSLLCSLCLILAAIHDWRDMYTEKITELKRMKAYMAYVKNRPHFVYNSLATISQIAKKSDPTVSALADSFSDFLRKNINDLASDELSRFSEELKHLENYLRLEKSRFGPELYVKVNVETGDFLMPRLVLQQLVETVLEFDFANSEEECILLLNVTKDPQGVCITLRDKTRELYPDKEAQVKLNEALINIEKKLQTYPGAVWQLNGDEIHPSTIYIHIPTEIIEE